jgi:tagatose-1,6-bisphosphate aldolase
MGLFGYNKRDFEKNTEKFKKKIENIATLVSDLTYNFMGKKRGSLMKYLSMCMEDLTIITYNEYGSDYKMIDKEINNILGNIEEALSKKEGGSAVGYAELLRDEISCCRRYGKNVFSDSDRKNKLRKIEIIFRLSDIAEKREAIANRKNEIIELALKSSEEMTKKYKVEYDALCSEEENLSEQFRQYQELYKTHIAYMNALENKKFADEIKLIVEDLLK